MSKPSVANIVGILAERHDAKGLNLKEIKQELVLKHGLPQNFSDHVVKAAILTGIRTRQIKRVRFKLGHRDDSIPDYDQGGKNSKRYRKSRVRIQKRDQHHQRRRSSSSRRNSKSLRSSRDSPAQPWPRSESRREIRRCLKKSSRKRHRSSSHNDADNREAKKRRRHRRSREREARCRSGDVNRNS